MKRSVDFHVDIYNTLYGVLYSTHLVRQDEFDYRMCYTRQDNTNSCPSKIAHPVVPPIEPSCSIPSPFQRRFQVFPSFLFHRPPTTRYHTILPNSPSPHDYPTVTTIASLSSC